MDEFAMFLRWRFGVEIGQIKIDIKYGKIWTFILPEEQVQLLLLLSQNEWESKSIAVENWIAYTQGIPVSMQGNSGYEFHVNQLKLWGSDLFIEAMLQSLINPVNERSEQKYIVPVDQIIQRSGDEDSVRFLNNLVNTDEIEKYNEQFIPLDFVDDYMETRTGIEFKTGLLVGLALTYRNLRDLCAGFDKVQYTGVAEKDSKDSVKENNYKFNEQACSKGMEECKEYLRLLDWR